MHHQLGWDEIYVYDMNGKLALKSYIQKGATLNGDRLESHQ